MSSYASALGAGYATIGEYIPQEAAQSASFLTHTYLPRPEGDVVSRSRITNLAQVRDYARAGFHAVVDAYARAPDNALSDPFVKAGTTYALAAKRAALVASYDYGSRSVEYATLRSELLADLASADAAASVAMRSAPAASSPAPSNVIRLPVPTPATVTPPPSVSTAGIGTAKGLAIAAGVGLVAYALMKRKKKS